MGNKKKTKWRKVPSAELSQITFKNSSDDQARSEDKCFSDEISGGSGKYIENSSSECCDLRHQEFPNPNQLRCYDPYEGSHFLNGETNVANADGISGIYVNGLWIPVSNQKKNCTNFSATTIGPNSVLQASPYFRPSSFCPSTCPRFQTVHAPDVPLHPNYFVPSENHYLYYFIRGQPNCSSDYFGGDRIDRTNGEECTDNYHRSNDGCYPDQRDSVLTKTLKKSSAAIKRIDPQKKEHVKNCTSDQHQDYNIEEQGNLRTIHQYPGYAFGHPLYSIPLVTFTPNANAHAQTTSWPLGPIQRKRRRRRKGYAEYAVIPPKKNNPEFKNSNETTPQCKESNFLKTNKKNLTENIVEGTSDDVRKYSPSTFSQDKNIDENIPSYASLLSEQVLSKTRDELKNIFSLGSSNISKEETSNEYREDTTTTDEVLQDICKNVLNTIVSEIVDKIPFVSEHTSLKITNSMLSMHPSRSSEIEVMHFESDITKQRHENIKVHNNIVNEERKSYEPDKLNKNILKANQLPFSEDNNVANTENYKNDDFSKAMKSECSTDHNQQISEKMSISTADANENITVSADKLQSENFTDTQCFPVTQQPRITHAFQDIIDIECSENEENFTSGVVSKCKTNNTALVCRNDSNENEANNHLIANDNAKQIIHPQNERPFVISNKGNYKNEDREELMAKVHNICKEAEISHDVPHLCQSPFMPHTMSSEVLIRETELELSKIHQLTSSSTANQSIYKLAYDDCVTDQSENEDADEKTQSKPESNHTCSDTCRSLENDAPFSEIIVHEADSTSEAGSEDVELLPHRYQSESVQDCNKHVYVNNLSLAVEMLRTREDLPYDDEFKRIVEEDNTKTGGRVDKSRIRAVNTEKTFGMENPAFLEELPSNSFMKNTLVQENVPKIHSYRSSSKGLRHSDCRTSISDSGVQSGDSGDEMAEEADEVLRTPDENINKSQQWHSDQTANYRRFGQQMRQQFSVYTPRASIMKPCLCCIVM